MASGGEDLRAEALSRLPHGKGFRFVDAVTELQPGVSGAGTYRLRGDERFLDGHFPGAPSMPGVLLIEAAAQLAGVVAQCDPEHPPVDALKLTAVKNAKIQGTALPGDTIQLEARVERRMGLLILAKVRAAVGGRSVLVAEVMLGGQRAIPGVHP